MTTAVFWNAQGLKHGPSLEAGQASMYGLVARAEFPDLVILCEAGDLTKVDIDSLAPEGYESLFEEKESEKYKYPNSTKYRFLGFKRTCTAFKAELIPAGPKSNRPALCVFEDSEMKTPPAVFVHLPSVSYGTRAQLESINSAFQHISHNKWTPPAIFMGDFNVDFRNDKRIQKFINGTANSIIREYFKPEKSTILDMHHEALNYTIHAPPYSTHNKGGILDWAFASKVYDVTIRSIDTQADLTAQQLALLSERQKSIVIAANPAGSTEKKYELRPRKSNQRPGTGPEKSKYPQDISGVKRGALYHGDEFEEKYNDDDDNSDDESKFGEYSPFEETVLKTSDHYAIHCQWNRRS
ncbi:Endonuclease/Exonuclease/phosphatase family protein [Rhizobium sp. AN5]|uniref:hypothetical protein n=1 Tax=Rhizobium sp. AN5 TaxID=1855304 RepID=UPI000BDB3FE0|nr:hypothetical protein [Rhizobium sp. AN5]SOC90470.1 Endonuclease/Exonuclease/phosphatase family protein [Rhizobium sp. AN5]